VDETARRRTICLRSNVVREDAHGFYGRLGYENVKTSFTFRKACLRLRPEIAWEGAGKVGEHQPSSNSRPCLRNASINWSRWPGVVSG